MYNSQHKSPVVQAQNKALRMAENKNVCASFLLFFVWWLPQSPKKTHAYNEECDHCHCYIHLSHSGKHLSDIRKANMMKTGRLWHRRMCSIPPLPIMSICQKSINGPDSILLKQPCQIAYVGAKRLNLSFWTLLINHMNDMPLLLIKTKRKIPLSRHDP